MGVGERGKEKSAMEGLESIKNPLAWDEYKNMKVWPDELYQFLLNRALKMFVREELNAEEWDRVKTNVFSLSAIKHIMTDDHNCSDPETNGDRYHKCCCDSEEIFPRIMCGENAAWCCGLMKISTISKRTVDIFFAGDKEKTLRGGRRYQLLKKDPITGELINVVTRKTFMLMKEPYDRNRQFEPSQSAFYRRWCETAFTAKTIEAYAMAVLMMSPEEYQKICIYRARREDSGEFVWYKLFLKVNAPLVKSKKIYFKDMLSADEIKARKRIRVDYPGFTNDWMEVNGYGKGFGYPVRRNAVNPVPRLSVLALSALERNYSLDKFNIIERVFTMYTEGKQNAYNDFILC